MRQGGRGSLRIAVVLGLTAAIGAAASAGAPQPAANLTVHAPDAYNPGGAPFQLRSAQREVAGRSAATGAGQPWSFAFEVQNTSASVLRRIGVEAAVFRPSGELAGYLVFEMPVLIQPGASVVTFYTTAAYRVAPADHVVVLPYSAVGAERWRMRDDELRDVTRALAAARGDAAAAPLMNVQAAAGHANPQNQNPDPGGTGGCSLTSCQNAQTACKDTCSPCGIQNATCSCNPDGTVSSVSCSCYQCTPPPK